MAESNPPNPPGQEIDPSSPIQKLDELPEYLGYRWREEMQPARDSIVEAMRAGDIKAIGERTGAWQDRVLTGEAHPAGQLPDDKRDRLVIGLSIEKALMWRDASSPESPQRYAEELTQAYWLAWNTSIFGLARFLNAAISEVEASIPNFPLKVELSQYNNLYINDRIAELCTNPAVLQRALTGNHDAIRRALEAYRQKMQEKNPGAEISLAPFIVLQLGNRPDGVLSPTGLVHLKDSKVLTSLEDILEEFHPYWSAVKASGLTPEVRVMGDRSGVATYLFSSPPNEPST